MPESVYVERWCPVHAAPHATQKVLANARCRSRMAGKLLLKARLIEPDRSGVFREMSIVEHPLMFEEGSMHLAEISLSRSGFCGFSRMLGMPDLDFSVSGKCLKTKRRRDPSCCRSVRLSGRTAAVGTLEVTVFDERHGGVLGTFRVVTGAHWKRQLAVSHFSSGFIAPQARTQVHWTMVWIRESASGSPAGVCTSYHER